MSHKQHTYNCTICRHEYLTYDEAKACAMTHTGAALPVKKTRKKVSASNRALAALLVLICAIGLFSGGSAVTVCFVIAIVLVLVMRANRRQNAP